ncbi:MAG: double-cubane-cluster-containing anaerobic reductase [Kiritimatiellia bacterium]
MSASEKNTCCGKPEREWDQPVPASVAWFEDMIPHALAYAQAQKAAGHPVVGIMCEYAPRELIMAAGGVPVCLCGGSATTIPAAERFLPANLCPLIKSTFGYHVQKSNPFLEMADLVVAETTCDGKKKMIELLAATRPVHVLELPQKPNEPDALAYWVQELRKLKDALETRFNTEVTDQKLRDAIATMNRERRLRRELARLMQADNPPLTGCELLNLKSIIAAIPEDLAHFEAALREIPGRQLTPPANQRVRVLLTGVPMPHGAEHVIALIESNGGLVVCQENCTGLKPILEDVDEQAADPIQALAAKYFHLPCSVMLHNDRRLDSIEKLVDAYRPQCIVEVVWQACLTYDVESARIRRLAEETLKLPYLRIETDYSRSDAARLALRIEALFETVHTR